MDGNNNKRSRASNFSNEEKLNLLTIIKKYKNVIENKQSGVQTWKTKEDTWKLIEKDFNSTSSIYRSADVLKRFYNNKKKETRKHAAYVRSEMNKTGGGKPAKIEDDPVYNLTLDIINKKTVFGLKNKFDSDVKVSCSSEISNTEETQNTEEMYGTLEDSNGMDEENEVIILEMETGDTSLERNVMLTFQQDTNEELEEGADTFQTPETLAKGFTQTKADIPVSNTWHRRRRPQLTKTGNIALRYEEVANIKKEVLQCQLNILKLQQAEFLERIEWEKKQRQLREQREKEEFEIKKKSLLLDVEIKEVQLTVLNTVN